MENVIKLDMEQIINAFKKASYTGGSQFLLQILPKDPQFQNKNAVKVQCSNGIVQAETIVLADLEIDITEVEELVVENTILQVLSALYQDTEEEVVNEVIFEIKDTILLVKYQSAVIPMNLVTADEIMRIELCNPEEESCLSVVFDTKELKDGISKVSCAYEYDAKVINPFNDSIIFAFNGGETAVMDLISCDIGCVMMAGTKVACTVSDMEYFKELANKNKLISLSANFLEKIVKSVIGESVTFFIFDKQVIIHDGMSFFVITMKDFSVKLDAIKGNLFQEQKFEFEVTVDRKELQYAIDVSTLNKKDDNNKKSVIFNVLDGKLEISSRDGANRIAVSHEKLSGDCQICVRKDKVLKAMATCGKTVTLKGNQPNTPLYVFSETDGTIFMAPIAM